MPVVYSQRSQCEGKVPYYTKAAARAAVKRNEQHFGARLRRYRCPWCGHFHIGNAVPAKWRNDSTSTAPANVIGPGDVASVPGPDQPERS